MTESFPLILLGVLLSLSAFFSACEAALFSLTRIELRRTIELHPRRGKLVSDLLTHPRRALITILIGNNIANTSAAALATLMALHFLPSGQVGIAIALFSILVIFVGEVSPKVFAVRKNEAVALFCAPLLEIFDGLELFLPGRI